MRRLDLAGQTFGRLRVLAQAPTVGGRTRWLCLCECGNKIIALGSNLREGQTQSCGCLYTRHGHSRGGRMSPTYHSWASMWQRCTNPKHQAFANYGGRGINICERWKVFDNFLADMGERPEGRTLDRRDNDGNYEPGNCQWATRSEQNRNRRPRRKTPAP